MSLVILLVGTAMPALAAWVSGIANYGYVKEPFAPNVLTMDEQKSWPGQELIWQIELKNNAGNITYGAVYDSWAWYDYRGYGVGSYGVQNLSTENEMTQQREILTLDGSATSLAKEMAGGVTAVSTSVGKLTLLVDPDGSGPEQAYEYSPGTIINIPGGGTHILTLKLKVNLDAPEGSVIGHVGISRRAPVE